MKQLKTILFSLPFVLAAVGCSQDELTDMTSGGDKGKVREVPITLSLGVNAGLRSLSRSADNSNYVTRVGEGTIPRELTSWDPAQQVNDMRIYVFRADTEGGPYIYYGGGDMEDGAYNVTDENNGIFANVVPHTGPFEEHTYTFKPLLSDGYYKFLAVGRDDKEAQKFDFDADDYFQWGFKVLKEPQFKLGQTSFHDTKISGTVISVEENMTMQWCTELFSGIMLKENDSEDYIHVDDKMKGFGKRIELQRAVAGLMIYVKNIPYKVEANYNSKGLFTPQSLNITVKYISSSVNLVNREPVTEGASGLSSYVASINLEDGTWGNDGEIFTRKAQNGLAENSAMSSNFLMPTSAEDITNAENDYEATLVLEYYAYESRTRKTYIARKNIKIKSAIDPNDPNNTPTVPEGYIFPIEANYLYSLGRKDSQIDEPYDLSPEGGDSDNNLVITVYPNWDWKGELEWAD